MHPQIPSRMTVLLHAAYARLGGMGFSHTAVDQTEAVTRKRIARGLCLVAADNGTLVGTIMVHAPGQSTGCPCYERPDTPNWPMVATYRSVIMSKRLEPASAGASAANLSPT